MGTSVLMSDSGIYYLWANTCMIHNNFSLFCNSPHSDISKWSVNVGRIISCILEEEELRRCHWPAVVHEARLDWAANVAPSSSSAELMKGLWKWDKLVSLTPVLHWDKSMDWEFDSQSYLDWVKSVEKVITTIPPPWQLMESILSLKCLHNHVDNKNIFKVSLNCSSMTQQNLRGFTLSYWHLKCEELWKVHKPCHPVVNICLLQTPSV